MYRYLVLYVVYTSRAIYVHRVYLVKHVFFMLWDLNSVGRKLRGRILHRRLFHRQHLGKYGSIEVKQGATMNRLPPFSRYFSIFCLIKL